MQLSELKIFHLSKSAHAKLPAGMSEALREALKGSFHLDSCQRWLWIARTGQKLPRFPRAVEGYQGTEAYRFLLSLACGLESEVVGETDIFGQLKDAWRRVEGGGAGAELRAELAPWMQKVFEDAKEIRSRFLRSLGGGSYGSLVRLFLREAGAEDRTGPILLVGAGKIATAIAPFLCELAGRPLRILNRDVGRAEELRTRLLELHPGAAIEVVSASDAEAAWAGAGDAVVCIPFDQSGDAVRVAAWKRGAHAGRVLHLGGARAAAGIWTELAAEFHSLDELFALQRARNGVRSLHVERARAACVERAKLRALSSGGSITIAHGWEDLALFG